MTLSNVYSRSSLLNLTNLEIMDVLKTLSKDELKQIYQDLLTLEDYKTTRKIDYYVPHQKQLQFHKSQKRKRVFFGGNGCGKTFSMAAEVYYFVSGKHPYRNDIKIPCDVWVVSVDYPTSKGVAEKKIKELFPLDEIKKWNEADRILEMKNGSTVGFKSVDSGRIKFQGTRKRLIAFDEEPLDIIFTMTPLLGKSFMYERLYEPWMNQDPDADDVEVITASIYDNEYSSAEVVKNLERSFKGTPDERSRLFGEFTSKSGVLYPLWNRKVHLVKPNTKYIDEKWTVVRALDPHPATSIYCLWLAVSPDNDSFLVKEYVSKPTATIAEAAKVILRLSEGMNILYTVIDTSANAQERTSGKTTAQLFRDQGIPVRNAIKDLESGYHCCSMALKGEVGTDRETGKEIDIHKFFVFDDLKEFIYQVEHTVWDDSSNKRDIDPRQKQKKKRDHFMDAWRYLMRQKVEHIPEFISGDTPYRSGKFGLY